MRTCDITGEDMYEGFVFDDNIYIKHQKDLVKKIKKYFLEVSKEWTEEDWLEFSYNQELHYWTEWYEDD